MRNAEQRDADAAQLAEILCNDSTSHKGQEQLEQMPSHDVHELCTNILGNGHTILHMLAQRQKLNALRAVLKRGVDVHTRNGHGATPLLVALQHNALFSAKVLIDHGANVQEMVSRRKGTTLLHLMVACDRPHAAMLLLEEEADANARDAEGRTPFHLAAIYGNTVITAVLIRHEQCDVNAVDSAGHSALMLAILNNNQELARQLVDAPRVDPVMRDGQGMASLHHSVAMGQLEVARTILRRNTAHINGKERRMGRTPIHFACTLVCGEDGAAPHSRRSKRNQLGERAEKEEEAGSPGLEGDEELDSVSRTAVAGSALHCPDAADLNGSAAGPRSNGDHVAPKPPGSPMSVSYSQSTTFPQDQSSHPSLPQLNGGPRDKQSLVNGHSAQSTPRTPRARTSGPDTPRDTQRATTPRSVPSRTGTPTATTPRATTPRGPVRKRAVVKLNPQMRAKTTTDLYSNSRESSSRHSLMGEHLLSPRTHFISTPKHKPATVADGARVHRTHSSTRRPHRPSTAPAPHRQLFGSIFSLNHPGYKIPYQPNGRESAMSHRSRESTVLTMTPVNVAIIRCRLVSLLLDHGADANLMTNFRKSPLHLAAAMGLADVMALILPHVTNPNVLSVSNKTALHLAAEGGHVSMVQQLINAGANLMLRDINGMTALHLAAALGHIDIVALLLRANAEKNSCDFSQMMPLHHACLHGHREVVDLLIQAGAELGRVDNAGHLPLEYLSRRKPSTAEYEVMKKASETLTSVLKSKGFTATLSPTTSYSDSNNTTSSSSKDTSSSTTLSSSSSTDVNRNAAQQPLPPLPPASTTDTAWVTTVNINSDKSPSSGGCEALELAEQLQSAGLLNNVNGSAQSGMLSVAPQPRRRKTGVYQTFSETTAVQAVADSNQQPRLYTGIPQAS